MKKLSLQVKLIGAFALVSLLTVTVGCVGYNYVNKFGSALYEIGAVRLPSIEGLALMNEAQTAIDSGENALLCRDLDDKGRAAVYVRIESAWKRVEEGWKLYEPLPQTEEEARQWKLFVPAWESWKRDHQTYLRLCHEYQGAVKSKNGSLSGSQRNLSEFEEKVIHV